MTTTNPTTPDQGDERRAFQRWEAYAKRAGFLDSNGNAYDGQQKEAQTSWFTWQACEKERDAAQPVAQEASRYRCSNCKSPLRQGWVCDSCDSEEAEPEEIPAAQPPSAQGECFQCKAKASDGWALYCTPCRDAYNHEQRADAACPLSVKDSPIDGEQGQDFAFDDAAAAIHAIAAPGAGKESGT